MRGGGMAGLGRNGCPGLDSSTANTGSMSAARAIDLGQRRELRRVEQRSRRRMSERRRRRTLPGEIERGRGEKQARVLHYLGAELLEGLKSTGTRRNGGVAENSELWLNNGGTS